MSAPRVLIVGAGALGLGFLLERLAGTCEAVLADRNEQRELLERIERERGYTVSICGPDRATIRRVEGHFRAVFTDDPGGAAAFEEAVARSPIILTATGRSVLPQLVPMLGSALRATGGRHAVLFCENGVHLAAEHGPALGPSARAVDTVMSRMCRFADPDEDHYEPLWPGSPYRLVAEEYTLMPVADSPAWRTQASGAGISLPDALTAMDAGRFRYWEDVKVYMHNAMHAFVAYHDALEGVRSFPGTPQHIRDAAHSVMMEEVVPSVVRHHPRVSSRETREYAGALLERFYNPCFAESVERGIRGTAEKLVPGGRLRGGVDYIREAGIEPVGFEAVVKAAEQMLACREDAVHGGR